MGLSWARLTLPLRKERQCYDLRFQRALANLRKTSSTEASNRPPEDRIREARRTLPCNRYKQLREGESAFLQAHRSKMLTELSHNPTGVTG